MYRRNKLKIKKKELNDIVRSFLHEGFSLKRKKDTPEESEKKDIDSISKASDSGQSAKNSYEGLPDAKEWLKDLENNKTRVKKDHKLYFILSDTLPYRFALNYLAGNKKLITNNDFKQEELDYLTDRLLTKNLTIASKKGEAKGEIVTLPQIIEELGRLRQVGLKRILRLNNLKNIDNEKQKTANGIFKMISKDLNESFSTDRGAADRAEKESISNRKSSIFRTKGIKVTRNKNHLTIINYTPYEFYEKDLNEKTAGITGDLRWAFRNSLGRFRYEITMLNALDVFKEPTFEKIIINDKYDFNKNEDYAYTGAALKSKGKQKIKGLSKKDIIEKFMRSFRPIANEFKIQIKLNTNNNQFLKKFLKQQSTYIEGYKEAINNKFGLSL